MNQFHRMTEIEEALVESVARALSLRFEPLPPLLTDAIALNSALARLARRIDYETHMYRWATGAESLRMTSAYRRRHAKLKGAAVWHRTTPWGSVALKSILHPTPNDVVGRNRDAISLEFLLNAIAEDPLIMSTRRDGPFPHLPIDILLTKRIHGFFEKYSGPGVVHPFEGRHFVQGCVVNIYCDARKAVARAGVASALSRIMTAELDADIVSLVQEARRTHETSRPH